METTLKRNYPRRYIEVPILYSDNDGERHAKMYNTCVDGMYFETLLPLKPGDNIRIKIENPSPDLYYSPEAFTVKTAKVRWCSRIPDHDIYGYGVGVKYE